MSTDTSNDLEDVSLCREESFIGTHQLINWKLVSLWSLWVLAIDQERGVITSQSLGSWSISIGNDVDEVLCYWIGSENSFNENADKGEVREVHLDGGIGDDDQR